MKAHLNATAVNCLRWHTDNDFAYRFELRERVSQEGLCRDRENVTSSAFTCTFLTITIMTDKSPRQLRR